MRTSHRAGEAFDGGTCGARVEGRSLIPAVTSRASCLPDHRRTSSSPGATERPSNRSRGRGWPSGVNSPSIVGNSHAMPSGDSRTSIRILRVIASPASTTTDRVLQLDRGAQEARARAERRRPCIVSRPGSAASVRDRRGNCCSTTGTYAVSSCSMTMWRGAVRRRRVSAWRRCPSLRAAARRRRRNRVVEAIRAVDRELPDV